MWNKKLVKKVARFYSKTLGFAVFFLICPDQVVFVDKTGGCVCVHKALKNIEV